MCDFLTNAEPRDMLSMAETMLKAWFKAEETEDMAAVPDFIIGCFDTFLMFCRALVCVLSPVPHYLNGKFEDVQGMFGNIKSFKDDEDYGHAMLGAVTAVGANKSWGQILANYWEIAERRKEVA
jgi:hypothetical protein